MATALAFLACLLSADAAPRVLVDRFDTCIVQDGEVACMGRNNYGQLGLGHKDDIGDDADEAAGLTLFPIDLGDDFVAASVTSGEGHHCAVSVDHRLKCWGRNTDGQLGYGDTENRGDEPNEMGANLMDVDLGAGFDIDSVSLGARHTCAHSVTNAVKCFGLNHVGQLGNGLSGSANSVGNGPGEMGSALAALTFPSGFVPVDVTCGSYTSCAVSDDFRVACFGHGAYGIMGQGNKANALTPTLVDLGDGFDVDFVDLGHKSACAVSTGGEMKCWGRNDYGQLGYDHLNDLGDNANEMGDNLAIVDVGIAVIAQVNSGQANRCALSADGKVKCWGRGTYGALGNGDQSNIGARGGGETGASVPYVPLGADFNAVSLSSGGSFVFHHCAVSQAASVLCWGYNWYGQLGLGNRNKGYTPAAPLIQFAFGSGHAARSVEEQQDTDYDVIESGAGAGNRAKTEMVTVLVVASLVLVAVVGVALLVLFYVRRKKHTTEDQVVSEESEQNCSIDVEMATTDAIQTTAS